jgi:hypothetical protein
MTKEGYTHIMPKTAKLQSLAQSKSMSISQNGINELINISINLGPSQIHRLGPSQDRPNTPSHNSK